MQAQGCGFKSRRVHKTIIEDAMEDTEEVLIKEPSKRPKGPYSMRHGYQEVVCPFGITTEHLCGGPVPCPDRAYGTGVAFRLPIL